MIKNWFGYSKTGEMHPSEEDLLKSVDGELSSRHAGRVREHLEVCWTCRRSLEKIQETISAFVEFRQQVQIPLTQPPNNWTDFSRKLKDISNSTSIENGSWWSRVRFGSTKFFSRLSEISAWSPMQKQGFVGTLAFFVIIAILWQFIVAPPVTAAELLDRSMRSTSERLREVPQAVVYQKVRVATTTGQSANWELWQDTTRLRIRRSITGESTSDFSEGLLRILRANGFALQQPLSATAFANWRNALGQKSDEVKKQTGERGELLVLHTANYDADEPGEISTGILKLTESDLHPVSVLFQVLTDGGSQTFEITEVDYSVVSLTAFAPDFFPETVELQPAETAVLQTPDSNTTDEAEANTNIAAISGMGNTQPTAPVISATRDLEMEVLGYLNQAKADLGEQITVTRDANGPVHVRGLVESDGRKAEILRALEPVRNNPAVRIELRTVAEAVAEQKDQPGKPISTETIESQSTDVAARSELSEYFSSEEAARKFGGQMIGRSSRLMSRAYALKRLASQFKSDDLRKLSPEARGKYLSIVRLHATAFREESEGLRKELQPVFGAINTGAAGTPDVDDIASIPRAIETLLSLASTNDRVVRSAFALSSSGQNFTAIRTSQFWQSLKTAEALATKLQSIR